MRIILLCAICLILSLTSCQGHDSEYIPYNLKGFNVFVYDDERNIDYFAGYIGANYFNREDGLVHCQSIATDLANAKHLERWSYVCCTATSSTDCATKVR
jgi:hypothetical protein